MASEPLHIESVTDRVYEALRHRIVAGELGRGERLRQEALADELGVSRTPLREALRRLAAEGLVELTVNRGAQVVDLTLDDVRAAYEARIVVEPGAARLAAGRRPADALAAMRGALVTQRAQGDAPTYHASRDFHLALARASGNDHLLRTSHALWVPGVAQTIFERQAIGADDARRDLAEHEAILAAIEAGDAELAETLTREHIRAAHRLLLAD